MPRHRAQRALALTGGRLREALEAGAGQGRSGPGPRASPSSRRSRPSRRPAAAGGPRRFARGRESLHPGPATSALRARRAPLRRHALERNRGDRAAPGGPGGHARSRSSSPGAGWSRG
jgi:hypothetical protein